MNQTTELLMSIRRTTKLYEQMLRQVCDRYGLTPIETNIVSFLKNNPEKDTAGDIVEFRMLSKGNVSQAVESLTRRGFLERRPDTEDRRKLHLFLRPEAGPVVEEIEVVWEQFHELVFSGFSEEERQQYEALNRRIIDNIRNGCEQE